MCRNNKSVFLLLQYINKPIYFDSLTILFLLFNVKCKNFILTCTVVARSDPAFEKSTPSLNYFFNENEI